MPFPAGTARGVSATGAPIAAAATPAQRRIYTAGCKDYQENTCVGVSSTITESESPSAASFEYCGYFA